MSATVDVRKADMPTPEELGDVEAIVYVAFEKVEQLAGLVKDYVDDQLGATAEECWLLHFTASYYESWGNSLVERAKELQQHAHDLGLNGLEAGIIGPWVGTEQNYPESTQSTRTVFSVSSAGASRERTSAAGRRGWRSTTRW